MSNLEKTLLTAVVEAIEAIGPDAFKKTSFFMSSYSRREVAKKAA